MKKPFTRGLLSRSDKNLPAKPQKIASGREFIIGNCSLLNVLLFRDFTFIFLFESRLPAEDIDNIL